MILLANGPARRDPRCCNPSLAETASGRIASECLLSDDCRLTTIESYMIGKIIGTLIEVDGNEGLIETASGVCYRVFLTPSILSNIPPTALAVYTYLQIRDDQHVLYGFDTKESYQMFQMLLTVDGVGPKTAHNLISRLPVSAILSAVHNKDLEPFKKVPGLGKKTAQKILLELSSKIKADLDIGSLIDTPINSDALETLVALGYRVHEARTMLKNIDFTLPVEKQVKLALHRNN